MLVSNDVTWQETFVTKADRHKLNQHRSAVIWLTGLSGAGKSTLANALDLKLYENHVRSYVLDGDNIRHGLNKGLGFSEEDRKENILRIGEVAKLFVDSGLITITAFISPFREDRKRVRQLFHDDEFIEVYVKCDLEECERRDPKGLYAKARNGEIKNFTGISSPYEEPVNPEIIVDTERISLEEATGKIIRFLREKEIIL